MYIVHDKNMYIVRTYMTYSLKFWNEITFFFTNFKISDETSVHILNTEFNIPVLNKKKFKY